MALKHAKAPWRVSDCLGFISDADDNDLVSDVSCLFDSELLGTMRVMAAGPEMLAALESLENDNGSIPAAIWQMRNEALAKAKGGVS